MTIKEAIIRHKNKTGIPVVKISEKVRQRGYKHSRQSFHTDCRNDIDNPPERLKYLVEIIKKIIDY